MNVSRTLLSAVAAATIGLAGSAIAQTATTFDQNFGQNITNQYTGYTFNVTGGPGPDGTPCECSFGTDSIGNSTTGDYPSGSDLDVFFASAVTNVGGIFNNFGDNAPGVSESRYDGGYGGNGTYVLALNALGDVVGYTNLAADEGGEFFVSGAGIVELDFNNDSNGDYSWEFGLFSLTPGATIPEPASIAAFTVGLAGLAMVRRRRKA